MRPVTVTLNLSLDEFHLAEAYAKATGVANPFGTLNVAVKKVMSAPATGVAASLPLTTAHLTTSSVGIAVGLAAGSTTRRTGRRTVKPTTNGFGPSTPLTGPGIGTNTTTRSGNGEKTIPSAWLRLKPSQ